MHSKCGQNLIVQHYRFIVCFACLCVIVVPCLKQDYQTVYLTADVGLLADCFEVYRREAMNSFGIDPAFYPTSEYYRSLIIAH